FAFSNSSNSSSTRRWSALSMASASGAVAPLLAALLFDEEEGVDEGEGGLDVVERVDSVRAVVMAVSSVQDLSCATPAWRTSQPCRCNRYAITGYSDGSGVIDCVAPAQLSTGALRSIRMS